MHRLLCEKWTGGQPGGRDNGWIDPGIGSNFDHNPPQVQTRPRRRLTVRALPKSLITRRPNYDKAAGGSKVANCGPIIFKSYLRCMLLGVCLRRRRTEHRLKPQARVPRAWAVDPRPVLAAGLRADSGSCRESRLVSAGRSRSLVTSYTR